ncbi:MAG: hypothetical protein ACRCV6_00300 [Formosimonas sp.]
MKYCSACHQKYADHQNFCSTDGHRLLAIDPHPVELNNVAHTHIIQAPANKSNLWKYIIISMMLVLVAFLGYIVWIKISHEKNPKPYNLAEKGTYEQRIHAAQLTPAMLQSALNNLGSHNNTCIQNKIELYQKRYNAALGQDEHIPTPAQTQQNLQLTIQASAYSCQKEAEALNSGLPSFDCNKAKQLSEGTICVHAQLAQLDVQLNNAAQSARFFATDKDKFDTFMKKWLKSRNNCADNADCLTQSYTDIINTLNSQAQP